MRAGHGASQACLCRQNSEVKHEKCNAAFFRPAAHGPGTAGPGYHRRELIERVLPVLAPEQDEDLLREEGFAEVGMLYAAGVFRGWIGHA